MCAFLCTHAKRKIKMQISSLLLSLFSPILSPVKILYAKELMDFNKQMNIEIVLDTTHFVILPRSDQKFCNRHWQFYKPINNQEIINSGMSYLQ